MLNNNFKLSDFEIFFIILSIITNIIFLILFVILLKLVADIFYYTIGFFIFIYIFFLISSKINLFWKIKTQKFTKLTIDDNSIFLITKDNCTIKVDKEDIIYNKIIRIGFRFINLFYPSSYGSIYNSSLVKIGEVEFVTKQGEKYSIIISNIESFIINTEYCNVFSTIVY